MLVARSGAAQTTKAGPRQRSLSLLRRPLAPSLPCQLCRQHRWKYRCERVGTAAMTTTKAGACGSRPHCGSRCLPGAPVVGEAPPRSLRTTKRRSASCCCSSRSSFSWGPRQILRRSAPARWLGPGAGLPHPVPTARPVPCCEREGAVGEHSFGCLLAPDDGADGARLEEAWLRMVHAASVPGGWAGFLLNANTNSKAQTEKMSQFRRHRGSSGAGYNV